MKICHLTTVHKYTDTRIFVKECVTLAESGYEVHLVAPDAPIKTQNKVHIHNIEKENGNRFKRMTKTSKKALYKALEIDADIYHFHDPELIPIGLKLKKYGKKVIYDVHEDLPRQMYSKTWIPKIIRPIISKVIEAYENKAASKFDAIITATPFIRERFLKYNKNSLDINNFPKLEEFEENKVNWKQKDNAVCYVGGLTFIRGINEIIKAINISNDVKLKLAGSFKNGVERKTVRNNNDFDKVEELGYLNREGVLEVYRQSKAGLVTLHPTINYLDALPVKMFEYMSAGIPVIASDFPLWKKIIEESQCGILVDPLNPQEISEAIDCLIQNPQLAERMGENGRKAIEEKYNWSIEEEKLLDIYQKI